MSESTQRSLGPTGKRKSLRIYCLATPLLAFYGEDVPGRLYSQAMQWAGHLDRQSWFLLFCGVLAIGAIFLRGFGSRSNY